VQTAESKRTLAAWLAAFALVVLGAKLWTIQLWATDIPYWDQWDEARLLFKPWLEGTLTWHNFSLPHNEHRIVFTRLLDLLEVKLNGQWDIYFQTVVNAFLHILYGCGLAAVLWHFNGRKGAGLIGFALLPFFALPFAAENTIHGFQSQFYFTDIFSLIAMLVLCFGKPCGKYWFCGLVAAVAAIFTMASGFLVAVAVLGLMILRALKQRKISREGILVLACAVAVIALGLAMRVTVAQDLVLQAKDAGQFFAALAKNLAWPFGGHPVMSVFIILPLVLVLVGHLRNAFKNPATAEFVLVFGLWGFLQAATLAFGRANLPDSSRYFDALSTLPIAAIAAWFLLVENLQFPRLPQRVLPVLAVLWFGVMGFGTVQVSRLVVDGYSHDSRGWGLLETENVRAFLATGDPGWLHSKMGQAIPYWSSDWLIDLLSNQKMLSIQPADSRPALKLEADEKMTVNFSDADPAMPGQPFAKVSSRGAAGTNSAANFVSLPRSVRLPKLSVQILCADPAAKFQFVEVSGRKIELHPQISTRWQTLVTDAPQSPFTLEIKAPGGLPVAIGDIKELGRFSIWSKDLVDAAVTVLIIGLICFSLLAVLALRSPQMSLAGGGAVWLFVLLIVLTAVIGVWCWRGLNGTEYAVALQKNWAVEYANAGHPARAEIHLREALWLQPDDADAQLALEHLRANGVHETLPEKFQ
jgi:hypothetical protein